MTMEPSIHNSVSAIPVFTIPAIILSSAEELKVKY